MLETHDLSTSTVDFVQFYIKLGHSHSLLCYDISSRQEHVLLLYSNNAGVTWHLLKEIQVDDYSDAGFVTCVKRISTAHCVVSLPRLCHSG